MKGPSPPGWGALFPILAIAFGVNGCLFRPHSRELAEPAVRCSIPPHVIKVGGPVFPEPACAKGISSTSPAIQPSIKPDRKF